MRFIAKEKLQSFEALLKTSNHENLKKIAMFAGTKNDEKSFLESDLFSNESNYKLLLSLFKNGGSWDKELDSCAV